MDIGVLVLGCEWGQEKGWRKDRWRVDGVVVRFVVMKNDKERT